MKNQTVVPIAQLGQRMQEQGRIRLGVKTARAMKSIDTFRFTSPDKEAIEQVAELYGGTCAAWNEPKANPPNQWEVITEAKEIRVFLPADALSTWYEQWSGGGCVRRCDGVNVEVTQRRGDDSDTTSVPCLCRVQNNRQCEPHTRLQVIIPEVRFGGVWRLETKGWTAAHEMPAMEQLISQLQGAGILEGVLSLERAQSQGGRKKFVVPRLRLATSAMELLSGQGTVAALHQGHEGVIKELTAPPPPPALDAGTAAPTAKEWYEDDDQVIDAEVVDDDTATSTGPSGKQRQKLYLSCRDAGTVVGVDQDLLRHALCRKASNERTTSSGDLTTAEASQVIDWSEGLKDGSLELTKVVSTDPPAVTLRKRP